MGIKIVHSFVVYYSLHVDYVCSGLSLIACSVLSHLKRLP